MNKRLSAVLLSALFSVSAFAAPTSYSVDPTHTFAVASWSHFGFSTPTAVFAGAEGTITYDAEQPAQSDIAISVSIETVDTFVDKLTEEFLGEEWFDALSNSQNGTTYLPITLNHWYWGGDPAWGSADNSGSYIWTLPNFSESMDSCLLAIWSYEDSYIYGISENYFSITSDSNYYDIDSPNGGEILYSGTEHQILWSSSGDVGDVKIYYSLFGGQSWYLIDDYKANDGSFTWSVPFVQGTNDLCRIKIQSVDRDDWFDISDNNFTISND